MKAGDLVMFRNCALEGSNTTGIITNCAKPSSVAKTSPALRLYWVFCGTDVLCFTGNQLVLV
jgi:hypothetical protein